LDQSPNFTPLSVATARGARNYAPAKPLQDVIRNKKLNKQPTKLEAAIRELYQHCMNVQKAAWSEIQSMAQLVALFREGQQLLQRRPFGAPGYYVRPLRGDDDTTMRQTAMNLMGFFSQACESKVIASNPQVNMRPGDDTPEAIAAAQACRPVVDQYETDWYTAKFSRREAIRFLTDGMVIHQVRWNPFLGGYGTNERQVSHEDVTIDEGGGECLDCDYEGPSDSFQGQYAPQCPECQSPAVDVRQPVMSKMARIGMGQSRPVGAPELVSSSLMSWRWDLTKDLEESPWAIKRQYITQGAVQLMLGDVTIPDSSSSEDYGLDILYALAYAGQAFAGTGLASQYRGTSMLDKRPVLSEFWLTPEYQAMLETEGGGTLCGEVLPKGKLSDFFRGESICLVGLNDFALTIGNYAKESQQHEVITAQWFMNAESGVGRGMEDTAAVQRRFNAVDGQIYQGLATTATPAVVTDMSLLKEDQGRYLFAPGHNIDISLALLPPNMKLSDAFFIGNPGAVSQQYVQYGSQFLREMAQISSLVTEFTNGLIGVDNRTATGAQITAQLANSLYGPMLASKGQMRVEIAKRIVSLVSAHDVTGRYYPGKGAAKGRVVEGKDLKARVVFELVQNSELPTTPFSQQTDIRVFFESFGGAPIAAQLKATDPEFFRATAAPFNINWGNDSDDDISTLCLKRLESMKMNLAAGNNDPSVLVEQVRPPVSKVEPKHPEKADWWSMYLDLEAGQSVPMELRQAIEGMYWLHHNMQTQQQIPQAVNQGLVAAAGAAPMALGQAALQPQETTAPEQDDSAKIESDERMESEKRQTELATKGIEAKTQLAVAETQGEYQLEATRLQGKNQVAAAKARPKPTVTKKSA
jgi:hypothetical protein